MPRCVERGDAIQASEKLYKVAEGCIKAMAGALGIEEAIEAANRGGGLSSSLIEQPGSSLRR